MIVLGLDTATTATTVAVWDTDGGRTWQRRDDPPPGARPRHTTQLLALAEQALTEAGAGWETIGLIATGVGPGTFTGIRIGVATARALAAAHDIPIVAVSTLRAVASVASHAAGPDRQTVAVLDARRREVFAAAWPRDAVNDPRAAPSLVPGAMAPQRLADELAQTGGSWLAVGDGAVAFRGVLHHPSIEIPDDASELHRVSAIEICRLGLASTPGVPGDVEPDYLRLPDAELNLRAREAQQSER